VFRCNFQRDSKKIWKISKNNILVVKNIIELVSYNISQIRRRSSILLRHCSPKGNKSCEVVLVELRALHTYAKIQFFFDVIANYENSAVIKRNESNTSRIKLAIFDQHHLVYKSKWATLRTYLVPSRRLRDYI
jgi:hypothetical protein